MPILAVAPHWGAWIEISLLVCPIPCYAVAPHWGAWIEISDDRRHCFIADMSHPTGVRGLKYPSCRHALPAVLSHPTGVRGLK